MLTMPGPEFLALYALLAVLAYGLVSYIIKRRELNRGSLDPCPLRDPYVIAYLRGGATELLRVTVLTLTLREKLRLEGELLTADIADGASADADSAPPIEAAVLRACSQRVTARQLMNAPQVKACIEDYRQELIRAQLLAGAATIRARLPVCLILMAALIVLADAKIQVAHATGHHNTLFLELLAAAAVISLFIPLLHKRTALGWQALEQLRGLFAQLRSRSNGASAAPAETALLAAVFGIYALGAHDKSWALIWALPSRGGGDGSCGGGVGGGGGGGGGGGCGSCGSCGSCSS